MVEHEWVEQEVDGGYVGTYDIYYCKNCGGQIVDIFWNNKKVNRPRRVRIPGTNVYLTNDCEESLKIMQTYWEKEGKKKPPLSLYKRKKKK